MKECVVARTVLSTANTRSIARKCVHHDFLVNKIVSNTSNMRHGLCLSLYYDCKVRHLRMGCIATELAGLQVFAELMKCLSHVLDLSLSLKVMSFNQTAAPWHCLALQWWPVSVKPLYLYLRGGVSSCLKSPHEPRLIRGAGLRFGLAVFYRTAVDYEHAQSSSAMAPFSFQLPFCSDLFNEFYWISKALIN